MLQENRYTPKTSFGYLSGVSNLDYFFLFVLWILLGLLVTSIFFFLSLPACPTVIVPAKVVQALNLNFDDMGGHAQPRFNTGFASDHGRLIFWEIGSNFFHRSFSFLLS
jgi:hypothetical protein